MKNVIDQILDEKYTCNIRIPGTNGEVFTFEQIALIHLDIDSFVILHPIDKDVLPDDVLVFKIEFTTDEASLILEEDEAIIQDVFDEYYALYKKQKNSWNV